MLAPLLGTLILLVMTLLFSVSLHRAPELFVLRVHAGEAERVAFVRGRIPPQLLRDLRDVLASADSHGTLRVLTRRGVVIVQARGAFAPEVQQRVRNVIGLYSLAKLRNGVVPRRR